MVGSEDKHLNLWLENSSNSLCFCECPLRRPDNDMLAGQIAGFAIGLEL